MLNAVSSLKGFEIQAKDGSLGTVSDFLFDDSTWNVRWLVVDTGRWLTGRKVLVHPASVISADYAEEYLNVALNKAQVRDSPDIKSDLPVSRQMQSDLYGYYGWDPLWGGGMYGGTMYGTGVDEVASPSSTPVFFGQAALREAEDGQPEVDDGDPHLRSITEVTGYHVRATDGSIGHIENFLIDNASWGVRYLVVDTSNWWVGQHVLISPSSVLGVEWPERQLRLDLTRERIRSSPAWDPSKLVDRQLEERLHRHYDWPR